MWLTSKSDAWFRVKWCDSVRLTDPYCTGIIYPAKGTIFAPFAIWKSYNGVLLSFDETVVLFRTVATISRLLLGLPIIQRLRVMAGQRVPIVEEGGVYSGWSSAIRLTLDIRAILSSTLAWRRDVCRADYLVTKLLGLSCEGSIERRVGAMSVPHCPVSLCRGIASRCTGPYTRSYPKDAPNQQNSKVPRRRSRGLLFFLSKFLG
jgi:hypothetical protein